MTTTPPLLLPSPECKKKHHNTNENLIQNKSFLIKPITKKKKKSENQIQFFDLIFNNKLQLFLSES